MRCSLVSLELRTEHRNGGVPGASLPQKSPLFRPVFRHVVKLASTLFCATMVATAQADGGALYSQLALSNPALPPALASDEHRLLWSEGARLRNQAVEALSVLREAPEHGMPEQRYALSKLTALATQLTNRANEDLFNELLTAAVETYAIDLLQGLQPSAFKDKRDPKHKVTSGTTVSAQLKAAVLKGLHRSIATNRVRKFVNSIEPAHPDYVALQKTLIDYRALAATGGWSTVPRSKDGAMLLPGAVDDRVPFLRDRLAPLPAGVELPPEQNPKLYDESLVAAVTEFQRRHGLKQDGKVGKNTRAALNVSAEERVRQLELNLDRWRLMPKVMPANHIWVNVPQYEMKLQLDRKEVLDMRVVVGKSKWPTPMMHDQLEHVVFSPYWYPPRKIAVREILPKLKEDPGYLTKKRFEVLEDNKPIDASAIDWQEVTSGNLTYRFRQRPGKGNSLGNVKFMFPNSYAVYMHDTNAKSLFDEPMRAFSHGCVRLEKPDALASALLEWDRSWKPEQVHRAMASGTQKYVKLGQTVPVYLVYFTATVENGEVTFHPDVYGHDARHKAQQDQPANTQVAEVLARYEQIVANAAQALDTAEPYAPATVQSQDATVHKVTQHSPTQPTQARAKAVSLSSASATASATATATGAVGSGNFAVARLPGAGS